MRNENDNITIRSIIIGMILSGVFAALTVVLENRQGMLPSGILLPLFPFIMLPILVVLVNPAPASCPYHQAAVPPELLIIFVMCMVSSGISTFGLT